MWGTAWLWNLVFPNLFPALPFQVYLHCLVCSGWLRMAKTTDKWDYLLPVPGTTLRKWFNPAFVIGTPEILRTALSSDRQGYNPPCKDSASEEEIWTPEINVPIGMGSPPVWNNSEHKTFPANWAAKVSASSHLGHSGHRLGWVHVAADWALWVDQHHHLLTMTWEALNFLQIYENTVQILILLYWGTRGVVSVLNNQNRAEPQGGKKLILTNLCSKSLWVPVKTNQDIP